VAFGYSRNNGNAQAITALIHSGYADGTWGGYGIITGTASTYTAIGITLNQNNANQTLYTTWSNQPVTGRMCWSSSRMGEMRTWTAWLTLTITSGSI